MATTLANLENLVRHYSRDNDLDIDTAGSVALSVTNKIYRSLAAGFPWPEFTKTLPLVSTSDATVTMADAVEKYIWKFETDVPYIPSKGHKIVFPEGWKDGELFKVMSVEHYIVDKLIVIRVNEI